MKKIKGFWPQLMIVILVVLFFYSVFLKGLVPIPADLIVGGYYPWLDYNWGRSTRVPVKNPIISDAVSTIYPFKFIAAEMLKKGELPFWNYQMFSGYPLISNLFIGIFFPSFLFYLFFPAYIAWTFQVMLAPFLGCLFMYLYLRYLKLSKVSALIGSLAFGFGGFFLVWLEWNSPAITASFLPLLLLAQDKLLKGGSARIKWGILFSMPLALQVFAGYIQIVLISLIALGLRFVLSKPSFKQVALVLLFGVLGIGLSAVNLVPAIELFNLSQRRFESIDPAVLFLPWQNLVGFFAPDYFGNHSTGNFWGQGNYTLLSVYSGLVTLVLAVFGFLATRLNKEARFLTILLVLTLLLILPNPIASLVHRSGFWGGAAASTTRANFLINFVLASLAAFGIENFNAKNVGLAIRSAVYIFSVVLATVIGTLVSKLYLVRNLPANFDSHSFKLYLEQINNLNIALRNLVIPIGLGLAIILLLVIFKYKKVTRAITVGVLAFLIVAELFRFGWKFNSFSDSKFLYPQTPVTKFLEDRVKEDSGIRINGGDVIPTDMWLPYGLESAEGYDSLYPHYVAKFISVLNTDNPLENPQGRYGLITYYDSKLFDLTSTKYVLALKRDKLELPDESGQVGYKFRNKKFNKIFEDKSVAVLENTKSLPRAFLVSRLSYSKPEEALKKILEQDFDIGKQAVVSSADVDLNLPPSIVLPKPSYERISNNHSQVQTESSQNAFLVVTDTFYPGWEAKIDGSLTKIFQTDYAFRGVFVPAGRHIVDFYYNPKSFQIGFIVSLLSFMILVMLGFYPKLIKIITHPKNEK